MKTFSKSHGGIGTFSQFSINSGIGGIGTIGAFNIVSAVGSANYDSARWQAGPDVARVFFVPSSGLVRSCSELVRESPKKTRRRPEEDTKGVE